MCLDPSDLIFRLKLQIKMGLIPSESRKFYVYHNNGWKIAQWICLCLPSCHPGFEAQAHHPCFYQIIFEL